MTKIIHKRKNAWIDIKLDRLQREIRTQPIMTALVLAVSSFGIYQCSSLPKADAVTLPAAQAMVLPASEDTPQMIDKPGDALVKVDFSYFGSSNKVGPLMAAYLGFIATQDRPAALPQSTTINWADNLRKMWAKKVAKKAATPATVKNADAIVEKYAISRRDTKTLREFVTQVDTIASQTRDSINYTTLCDDMDIDKDKCGFFRNTVYKLDGKSLVAYGMTEIFPAQNGEYNIIALDTILRNAGENYLDAIPALGDPYLSKGFYQFTSFAVRRDDTAVGGANYVDNHAGMKLPGSVLYLTGKNSHKAAFEFAVYNIGMLVRKLDVADARRLASGQCPSEQIIEFVAQSHHLPVYGVRNARKWVEAGCIRPLNDYTSSEALRTYAKKTRLNYKAVDNFL